MKSTTQMERMFDVMGKTTIGAVLFLILVGGIVRSTGAGMGCPDWPKCFGMWVPPTDVSELPSNYQEIYGSHGYADAPFNAVKTWIEYLNRLVGALIGLFVFATALLSLRYRKTKPQVVFYSIGAFLLTGFEGWLGAKVVDFNLAGWVVTIHMFFALIILMFLILAVNHAQSKKETPSLDVPGWLKFLPAILLVLVTGQILLGTQVREGIDVIAESMNFENRMTWVAELGVYYQIHRLFFLLPLIASVLMANAFLKKFGEVAAIRNRVLLIIALMFAEVLLGVLVASFGLPPYLQPLHLVVASILFTVNFDLAMKVWQWADDKVNTKLNNAVNTEVFSS